MATSKLQSKKDEDFFSIKDILPPQDAFAQRHIGPRKEERNAMLKALNYNVSCVFKILFFQYHATFLL